MAAPTLESVLGVPLTMREWREALYRALVAQGVTTTNWKPGAVVRTLIAGLAVIFAALHGLINAVAGGGFRGTAKGAWFTLVARHTYGIEREPATFAAGAALLSNATVTPHTFDPDELVFRNARTGKLYVNTAPVSIAGMQQGLSVPVQAREAGEGASAFAGEISELEAPIAGLSCLNPLAFFGLEPEDDVSLEARCTAKLEPKVTEPRNAYEYWARQATRPDDTNVGVTRVRMRNFGQGRLAAYVATATGGVPGTPRIGTAQPTGDIAIVDDILQRNAATLAVTLSTFSCVPLHMNVDYEVWMYNGSGYTEAGIQAAIAEALSEFFAEQRIGGDVLAPGAGYFHPEGIAGAIFHAVEKLAGAPFAQKKGDARAQWGRCIRVKLNAPDVPLLMGDGHVPVLGSLTAKINQVNAPGQA